MAEARFIKSVAFGGYDKADVIRRLEDLDSQVFTLRRQLRAANMQLEGIRLGEDADETQKKLLEETEARLKEVQISNDTLAVKLKAAEDENKRLSGDIESLNARISELSDKLIEADTKLAALTSDDEAKALSAVFIEAKKSSDMLIDMAKQKAAEIDENSKKAADKSIEYANGEALRIINDAEKKAAEIVADAMNDASAMEVSAENLRSLMLDDVKAMTARINSIWDALIDFGESGMAQLADAQMLLTKTTKKLTDGGTPRFRNPEQVIPEYPADAPSVLAAEDEEQKKKRKSSLEKLQQMAASLTKSKPAAAEAAPEKTEEKPKQPAQQQSAPQQSAAQQPASHQQSAKPAEQKKPAQPQNGAPQQKPQQPQQKTAEHGKADAKGGNPQQKGEQPKKGKVDLAALAAQAEALKKKK